MALAEMHKPQPAKSVCLLTALSAMALAAKIHGTDKAVMKTGFRMLAGLDQAYQPIVLGIINAPSPLKHMNQFVATLPPRILEMKVQAPALPLLSTV
jgi:hypothetical protein